MVKSDGEIRTLRVFATCGNGHQGGRKTREQKTRRISYTLRKQPHLAVKEKSSPRIRAAQMPHRSSL